MNKKVAQQYEASLTAYNDVYYKRDLVMRIKSELNDLFKLLTKEKSHSSTNNSNCWSWFSFNLFNST